MKRPVLLSLLVVPLLVVVILGGYWFLGTATETGVKRYFGGENPLQGATLELASYERGFFKSRATSSIRFSPDEEPVRLINEIYHGPFAFAPGGIKAGTGHVVTTLDLESLPQEVREKIASFYEGKDPLEITTDVNFGGSRTSTVTLASVDHDEDGAQIRFEGGTGIFSFSPDNSRIDGQLTIEPVSLRFKEENSNFRLRGDRTTVSLKMSSETTSVVADGGSINLSFDGDSQGSFEIEGMQFSSLFSPAGPHSKVMLGSGKFTLPGAKASWEEQSGGGQKGSFEMKDLSFETISAAGPNAALPHYHVSPTSNRPIRMDEIYLIDSGGQYEDGTTDITRTVIVGTPTAEMRDRFTRVLKGHVAISTARFPKGTTGAHLDALARTSLWQAGLDFNHGTGHGVGVYLSVHEGPQRISRTGDTPLEPGMILSNEPGYYREGAFGIRIETLVVVTEPAEVPGGDRPMMGFETITFAPIDRRLIDVALLSDGERAWIDGYHAEVAARIGPLVADSHDRAWLDAATRPLDG